MFECYGTERLSLHTALPSHRSVRQVATVPASPHCHATSSVRQASSSARQSRCAFDIRLAGAIVGLSSTAPALVSPEGLIAVPALALDRPTLVLVSASAPGP